ncbi:MAG: NTP transferase domain-containing protein [Vicinamibacterales bacterium]
MVSAVLLAAGASTRMGRPKLLLPLGGDPLVRHAARALCQTGVDEVLVVTGVDHDRIAAALDGLPVRFAVNPDFASGMGSSFRTGVEQVRGSDAALFALADQPFLTPADYGRLLTIWQRQAPIIVGSRFGDVTAPPHLFARALYPELAALTHGARSVLQRHHDEMVVVSFPAELLMDVDTPEDYARAQARLAGGHPLPPPAAG